MPKGIPKKQIILPKIVIDPSGKRAHIKKHKPKTPKFIAAAAAASERLRPWQFKKGQSGNPGGRPKLLSQAYKAIMVEVPEGKDKDGNDVNPERHTVAELIAQAIAKEAMAAEISAAREMRAATEGDLVRLFSEMSDAELDEYIAARQGNAGAGVDDTPTQT